MEKSTERSLTSGYFMRYFQMLQRATMAACISRTLSEGKCLVVVNIFLGFLGVNHAALGFHEVLLLCWVYTFLVWLTGVFPKEQVSQSCWAACACYCLCVLEKCKHGQSNHQLMQTVGRNPTLTCPLQVSGCRRLLLHLLLVAAWCRLFMLFLYV